MQLGEKLFTLLSRCIVKYEADPIGSQYHYTLLISGNCKVFSYWWHGLKICQQEIFATHSNSLYLCWSRQYYAVSCKQHDQHPIRRPCDQPSDQHPFLPQISYFLPHMTNNVTNSPRYPRIYYSFMRVKLNNAVN